VAGRGGQIDHYYVELLAIAVATADPLFHTLRIPWQIVSHHQRTKLQVDTFSTGFRGNQDFSTIMEVINQCEVPASVRDLLTKV